MDKRVNGVIKSIARTKLSRGAISKSSNETRLQTLVSRVADTIVVIAMNGQLEYISPSSLNLLGMKSDYLHGRCIYDLIHGADGERVRDVLHAGIAVDKTTACEFRMRHANGNIVWVEMRGRASSNRETVAVLRDIGERHRNEVQENERLRHLEEQLESRGWQLEKSIDLLKKQTAEHRRDREALEQSEMLYTALVENTLTGIYIHDGRKMTFCNERFAQIFGFDRDCLEDMDTDELFVGGRSVETLLSDMAHDELVKGKTCNGQPIWLKLSRVRVASGGQNIMIGNIIDVTEQVAINERLTQSELELHTLSAQLMAAQESERKRIANELHDGLGQRLSAIKFAAENIWNSIDRERYLEQSGRLGAVIESLRDSIEEVRRVSMDLRPSILDDLGLLATIGWFCREFSQLFPAIGVHRNIATTENEIPVEVKVVVFRIIQEAFHNIAQHSKADQVELELLSYNNVLRLMIRDNGCGIDALANSSCGKGLGLKSMRERAELTHGDFRIDSAAGRGTTIMVQWPLSLN